MTVHNFTEGRAVRSMPAGLIERFNSTLTPQAAAHIAMVPTIPDGVAIDRTFPAPHHHEFAQVLDLPLADTLRRTSTEHFRILRDHYGLVVPTIYASERMQTPQGVIIKSRVEYIPEGERFPEPRTWGSTLRHERQAAWLASQLTSYLRWVITERPDFFLADVTRIEQYLILPDGNIALSDVDPYMLPSSRTDILFRSLKFLHRWVRNLPTQESRDSIEEDILSLMEIVATRSEATEPELGVDPHKIRLYLQNHRRLNNARIPRQIIRTAQNTNRLQ